jgi:hypothetical protein
MTDIDSDSWCGWMWFDGTPPDDGSKHRHMCGLPPRHDGDHECHADDGAGTVLVQ